jgi:hypothetical protein
MNPEPSEWWKNEIIKESRDTRSSIFGSSNISDTTYHKNVYSSALKLAQKVHNNGYMTDREYQLMLDFFICSSRVNNKYKT